MDRIAKIQALYKELSQVETDLKAFVTPQRADTSAPPPKEWTQEQAERHASLLERRNNIVKELTDLEGGHL